ncbi:MAG: hypothetical protein IJ236_03180 [Oscillospiraceae bacterium]|nr:hypothetical protein [Oscillospiraceae bacterium]
MFGTGYEEDFIMRQIRGIIQVIAHLLFGVEVESLAPQLIEDAKARQDLETLLTMTDDGALAEAQDCLRLVMGEHSLNALRIGAAFYTHLYEKDDAFLEAHGCTRGDILRGVRQMAEEFGAGELAELFLAGM